jgi:uncharacterized membrane protein YfcA
MTIWVPIVLAVAALVTSTISAILGMGGGMLLLVTILCFMSHGEAIPTHAAVQIASNGTRVLAFIQNVDRGTLARFTAGVVPGAGIGMLLLWTLGQPERSEPYLKTLVGAFILVATFLPNKRTDGRSRGTWWDFPLMGLVAGTAALTVGAIGPLIAPLFARRGFVKERLIATKAVCQLTTHVLKIPAFILLRDLSISRLGTLALIMIVMVIPGTLIGKRMLKGVSERHFRIAYRVALTVAGLKVLLVDGLRNLPVWS